MTRSATRAAAAAFAALVGQPVMAPVVPPASPQVVPRTARQTKEMRLRLAQAERTMADYECGMVGKPFTPLMRKTLVALLASYVCYSWEEWVIVPHDSVRGQRMALMFDDREDGWYCDGTIAVYDDRLEMNDGQQVFYLQKDVEGLVDDIREAFLANSFY